MAKYDFVAVDVETAARTPDSCCSIGIVAVKEGQIVDSFSSLVRYEGTFSPALTKIHGITPQSVATAPSAAEVWAQASRFFSPHWPTVGHNIKQFDLKVLAASFAADTSVLWVVDTLHLCHLRLPVKPTTLENCAAYFDIDMGQYHSALDDARTAAKIILAICAANGYPELTEMIAKEPMYFGKVEYMTYAKFPERPDLHIVPKRSAAPSRLTAKELDRVSEASGICAITPTVAEIDQSNPLFGKAIVLTGYALSNPARAKELAQIAVNCGAEIKKDVSKKVDIVVCAQLNAPEESRTGKHKKALELNQTGKANIQIMSEQEFLALAQVVVTV